MVKIPGSQKKNSQPPILDHIVKSIIAREIKIRSLSSLIFGKNVKFGKHDFAKFLDEFLGFRVCSPTMLLDVIQKCLKIPN